MTDTINIPQVEETKPTATPVVDPKVISPEADKIAEEKISKLKEDLVESISGGKKSRWDDNGPKSWDEIVEKAKTETLTEAEERILAKIEAKEQERENERKAQAEKETQTAEERKQTEWRQVTQEWQEAVTDGLLPDIDPEVKEALKSGKGVNDLTPEQRNDPGLKAYNEVVALHGELKAKGESSSLYRTVTRHYKKQPGMSAPVMGGSTPVESSDDMDYAEIKANRLRRFGF
jgi:hypothetical protein